MTITINCRPLRESLAGVGNYLLSLLGEFESIEPDWQWRYQDRQGTSSSSVEGINKAAYRGKIYHGMKLAAGRYAPKLYDRARTFRHEIFSRSVPKSDIYFEPNLIALSYRAKRVVITVHDFSCYHHPEWHPGERIENFRRHFLNGLRRTDAIITPSAFVAQEARDYFSWDREIIAIHHGIRQVFLDAPAEADSSLESDYSLYVGAVEPRKNLGRLLKAWSILPASIRDGQRLLLVGSTGWKNAEVISEIGRTGARVHFLGSVPDAQLARLYRNARCLIYPSLYEGFGLPPLEAMACGCPVVVSRVSSLPEVCGDAAQYVDPNDVESIADGISKVLGSESNRQRLKFAGQKRCKQFSWRKSAVAHIETFVSGSQTIARCGE